MRKTLTAVAAAAALVAGLGWASPASAADATVPESQVDTTGNTGTVEFLNDGVYLKTADWSQEARGMYDVDTATAGVSGVSQDWQGSSEPGIRLEIDLGYTSEAGDPDGVVDGTLTYESVYGGNLWASASSSDEFKALAPHTAPGNGNNDGQGSQWYGTWEEWRSAFTAESEIARAGFLLGVPGRGTLLSQTIGDTTYTFGHDAPLPKAKPVAKAHITKPKKTVAKVKVTATQPDGTQPTKRGAFYRVLRTVKGAAADGVIEKSEIRNYLAKGRVQAGDVDKMRFRFRKFAKVTVVSYGEVLADKGVKAARKGWDRHGWDRHGWDRLGN